MKHNNKMLCGCRMFRRVYFKGFLMSEDDEGMDSTYQSPRSMTWK